MNEELRILNKKPLMQYNQHQQEVLDAAVNGSHQLYIINGSAGTGKTTVISELARIKISQAKCKAPGKVSFEGFTYKTCPLLVEKFRQEFEKFRDLQIQVSVRLGYSKSPYIFAFIW